MADQGKGEEHKSTVTIELLEDAVKAASHNEKAQILNFTTSRGSRKGDNYASVVTAVEVTTKAGDSDEVNTFHFIVKEIPPDPTWQKFIKEVNVFEKEIQMYSTILPEMVEVQHHFGATEPVKVETPVFYSSLKHPDFLVFDDLRLQGYRMANKKVGLDYNHCRLVMIELGKFHSLSYALKIRSKKPLVDQFTFLKEIPYSPKMEPKLRPMLNNSYDSAIKAMEGIDKTLAEKMKSLDGKAYETNKNILYHTDGLDFIGHGDLAVHNLFFKYEKSGDAEVPVAVKLLDFQVARVASPCVDLSQFLYSSTAHKLRLDHLKDLLQLYHDTFTNTLKSMSLEFPEFTFQRLLDKFHKDCLFGFFYSCMGLPFLLVSSEDAREFSDMDEDNVGEEFGNRVKENVEHVKDNREFHDRLRGIVMDIQDAGLI